MSLTRMEDNYLIEHILRSFQEFQYEGDRVRLLVDSASSLLIIGRRKYIYPVIILARPFQ